MGWLNKGPKEGEASLQIETTQPWLKAGGRCRTRRSWGVGLRRGLLVALGGGGRMGGAS